MSERLYRAGVDIGGTFTDIVVIDDQGVVHTKKVSSTPQDYGVAIVTGLEALLASLGATPRQVTELVHATTIATNTVLEGKGARTALVTTRGFRDVVEIGRLRVPMLYNLAYRKPAPLAKRRHRYEVDERLNADGSIAKALDEAEVLAVAERIAEQNIEAVAISLLHAYANPEHEIRVRELLRRVLGERVYLTCSHEILPEIREYERTSTTVVNAYLGPVVVSYLHSLIARLRDVGMRGPVQIMHSNGGVMSAAAVMQKPAAIIESGPAAGVIAGASVASASGYADCITVDMGGTTAKAAIIERGEPARTTEYEVGAGINLSSKLVKGGGHAVKLPFIDVSEIGAGGGSMVRIDAGGLVKVGPDSAGSVPGPVAYDAGGTTPTLTDAVLALGYLNPEYLAGGELRINHAKACDAMRAHVAVPTNTELHEAAYGVFSIAASTMTRAVKAVSTYRGRDPRDFALFAFGGNGPIIVHAIAALLDMRTVIVPPSPGVFSALGLLFSTTQHEFMQTMFRRLDADAAAPLGDALEDLAASARAEMMEEGLARNDIEMRCSLDLRYAGQAYELAVPLAWRSGETVDIEEVKGAFHAEHERTYGHASQDDAVELVNLRVLGSLKSERSRVYDARRAGGNRADAATCVTRRAYFGPAHGFVDTPVISRAMLRAAPLDGPVIVEEYDSTCVVPPGARARVDAHENIVITLGENA
ncbi:MULTISPECIES: hydantoinase/oxoprolinase family protein [unclassified Caballeronia]|uniref:hydantoinase/oxoprolinase family protein n=1 Tax=unclassified Caballeronia TaxID=2646786 RepID=UPI001F32D529|nr:MULTISPECIES: hydantoinase/oxoprolinase family protein [unclassified Caballeronia]MCE4541838.1 hydantoinase/oxoprolinase family protein [Caballeronia sp. PC1]MCE4569118.1 hydantoinase/oxoprolinase family protein [Caballeronia sp. CLC5]